MFWITVIIVRMFFICSCLCCVLKCFSGYLLHFIDIKTLRMYYVVCYGCDSVWRLTVDRHDGLHCFVVLILPKSERREVYHHQHCSKINMLHESYYLIVIHCYCYTLLVGSINLFTIIFTFFPDLQSTLNYVGHTRA